MPGGAGTDGARADGYPAILAMITGLTGQFGLAFPIVAP